MDQLDAMRRANGSTIYTFTTSGEGRFHD